MATINMKQGGATAGLSVSPTSQPGIVSIKVRAVDVVAANGGVTIGAGDVIQLMDIPAYTRYGYGTINVKTIDSGTAFTVNLGATNADEFIAAGPFTTLGIVPEGTGTFDLNLISGAADVLALTVAAETATGDDWVVEVLVEVADYTGNPRARSAKDVA